MRDINRAVADQIMACVKAVLLPAIAKAPPSNR
jgi:hypothetical protein